MAFRPRDLSVLAYANGFTLWHYKANDPSGRIAEPGYLDAAADMLAPGDLLMISATDGAQIRMVAMERQAVRLQALG